MQGLASKYGYQIVASQIVNPGSTNDTPQVLNLLKANPQVIVLGLTPGPDTITFLKSMRAQNPTIPIGECSGCATTQFVNAVGGPTTMSNTYLIGTPDNVLAAFPAGGANAAGLADTKAYIAAMKAAGLGTATQIDQGGEGWDTGRELGDAIDSAKSIASGDVKNALEKQKLTVGGIIMYTWTRSSSDHASMTDSGQSAMVTVAADSSFTVLPHVGG
jgi:ABC-type branched-subunit amino acid transport system substrate-binding protein